ERPRARTPAWGRRASATPQRARADGRPGGAAAGASARRPGGRAVALSGGGGIRTLDGPIRPITVFETAAFNHSATPPGWRSKGSESPAPVARERRPSDGWRRTRGAG